MSIGDLAGGAEVGPETRSAADMANLDPAQEPRQHGEEQVGNLKDLPARRQRRLILDLLRAGKSDMEIGERFSLSQWQVRNLRYRLGLKKDRGGRVAGAATRSAALEQEIGEVASRIARTAAEASTARRRLPRIPAEEDAERMMVRLAGRFDGADAGRRLAALGGLLGASEGRYEVRLAVRQLDGPGGE